MDRISWKICSLCFLIFSFSCLKFCYGWWVSFAVKGRVDSVLEVPAGSCFVLLAVFWRGVAF